MTKVLIAPAVALLVLACTMEAPEITAQSDGAALFSEHCAACHGATGSATGPLAADLGLTPPDLTRIAARDGGFDYARVMSVIDGYKAPARSMPAFGDMLQEAEFTVFDTGDGIQSPVPIPLLALAQHLEAIQVP